MPRPASAKPASLASKPPSRLASTRLNNARSARKQKKASETPEKHPANTSQNSTENESYNASPSTSLSHAYILTCLKLNAPLIPAIIHQFQASSANASPSLASNSQNIIPHLCVDLAYVTKSQYHALEHTIKSHHARFRRVTMCFKGDASKDYTHMWREMALPQKKAKEAKNAKSATKDASNVALDASMVRHVMEMTTSANQVTPQEIIRQFDWVHQQRQQTQKKSAAASQTRGSKTATTSTTKEFLPDIDVSTATRIANLLASHLISPSLYSLRLEGLPDTFNAQVWKIICSALKTKCAESLKEFSVSHSAIGDEQFRPIGNALKHLKHVEHFSASHCRLSNDSMRYFVNLIKMHQDIGITDQWIGSLRGETDAYDSGVRGCLSLDLSGNFFSDQACKMLASNLVNDTKMRVLNLSGNLIGENGIAMIDDFLVRSSGTQLQWVQLGNNPGTITYVEKFSVGGGMNTALNVLSCGELGLCFMRSASEETPARPRLSSVKRSSISKKRAPSKVSAARPSENSENQNPNTNNQHAIEQLETNLLSQQEENAQLRDIIKDMYNRMKRMKDKEKKRKEAKKAKRKEMAQHAEKPSAGSVDEPRKRRQDTRDESAEQKPTTAKPAASTRTHHKISIPTQKISEAINTDPDDSIDYDGLTLADIERELEQVDRNELPQYDVVLTLAKSVKQLTKMVDDLEGSMAQDEGEDYADDEDQHEIGEESHAEMKESRLDESHDTHDERNEDDEQSSDTDDEEEDYINSTEDAANESTFNGTADFTAAMLQRATEVFGT